MTAAKAKMSKSGTVAETMTEKFVEQMKTKTDPEIFTGWLPLYKMSQTDNFLV